MISICPSTNPSNEKKLIDYVKELQSSGIELLHCDVMDGKFVSAKCLSVDKIKEITANCLLQLDVHLMVENPEQFVDLLENINIAYITIHFEAFNDKQKLLSTIEKIHNQGKLVGLSVKPNTSISTIYNYLPLVVLILVMSVEPGKSGQTFNTSALDKISNLYLIRDKNKFDFKIEVDGGINIDNIQSIVDAGADMVVVGSALYNAPNRKCFIKTMEQTEKRGSNLKKLFPNYKATSLESLEEQKNRILCKK